MKIIYRGRKTKINTRKPLTATRGITMLGCGEKRARTVWGRRQAAVISVQWMVKTPIGTTSPLQRLLITTKDKFVTITPVPIGSGRTKILFGLIITAPGIKPAQLAMLAPTFLPGQAVVR